MIDEKLLNPEQLKAVNTLEGPLLIFAGAGSGKTRVLTYRLARLIEKGVPAWSILAITFTNKAAREMRERIETLCSGSADEAWVMTFHACCARILRRDIEKLGYKREFTIYDEDDKMSVIKRLMKEFNINEKNYPPRSIKAVISDAKNHMQTPEEWLKENTDLRSRPYYKIYSEYENVLKSNNALDFDDLLLKTLELLCEHPPVLESYRRKFSYIMVDEYQDTNMAQYQLVRLLAGDKRNVCVVGDDDQSIYGWRGADIRNIRNFEKDFPGCCTIKLEENYRSTANILDAANQVIAHNEGRTEKTLWTEKDAGAPIKLCHALDERDEAVWVCNQIKQLEKQGVPLGEMAVLYRTNAQSRVLEEALVRGSVKYGVYGGLKFYDRKEIKDVIAYLRLLVNPDDDVSFRRIINEPKRGIGEATLDAVAKYAQENGCSMYDAILDASEIGLNARATNLLNGFAELMVSLQEKLMDETMSAFIVDALELIGIKKQYENSKDDEDSARLENIDELVAAITEYEDKNPDEGILGFLENVALVTDTDRMENNASFVTLMTLHSAKGLEFDAVFLTGLEETIFPISRAMMNEDELEEERRLMYVGITRAKKQLFISHARTRMLYNSRQNNQISRFVSEIPRRLLDDGRRMAAPERLMPSAPNQFRKPDARTPLTSIPGVTKGFGSTEPQRTNALYKQGDKVRHRAFGFGIVREVRVMPSCTRVLVEFQKNIGLKIMDADSAPMTIVED